MQNSKQLAKSFKAIGSLIGISKASSQTIRTKQLVKVDYLCLFLVCISAGYLTTLQGFAALPINADSLAPFEEAKSLISNPDTHLFNIHVSRIASIFPDLTTTILLQQIHPQAGFLEIFSHYAWFCSSLFLLLATVLTHTINSKQNTLTAVSIKISLATIILLNISLQFNIVYAHLITPVHHGGNILNTILILILSINTIKSQNKNIMILGMSLLTVLATMSNKISIFSAVIPSIIIFITFLKRSQKRNYSISLILATAAGVFIGSRFNEQCATPQFNHLGTLSALSQYFQASWITSASAILSIVSIIYAIKSHQSSLDLPIQTKAGLITISLSSLSYFVYLPMLTSSGEAPIRYICIAYALIPVFFVIYLNRIKNHQQSIALSTMLVITLVSFQGTGRHNINITKLQSLKDTLIQRSERILPFKNDAAKFINEMGYNAYLGLGNYWISGATLATNSKIHVIPIHYTGFPDFWGATPQDVRLQIESLDQEKTYLLTEDDEFKQNFEEEFGPAVKTWNYNKTERAFTLEPIQTSQRIQIYTNPSIFKRVRKHSIDFKRQCNPSLPNYSER